MIFVLLALIIAIVYTWVDIFWVGWINPPTDGIWGTILAGILTISLMFVIQTGWYMYAHTMIPIKPMLITTGIIWFISDWLIRAPNYFGFMMKPPKKHDEDFEDPYNMYR